MKLKCYKNNNCKTEICAAFFSFFTPGFFDYMVLWRSDYPTPSDQSYVARHVWYCCDLCVAKISKTTFDQRDAIQFLQLQDNLMSCILNWSKRWLLVSYERSCSVAFGRDRNVCSLLVNCKVNIWKTQEECICDNHWNWQGRASQI